MTYDHRIASAYESLWRKLEDAVAAHPIWTATGASPKFEISRSGVELRIAVKKNGKGKVTEIFGKGPTPEAATDNLIEMLDWWTTRPT